MLQATTARDALTGKSDKFGFSGSSPVERCLACLAAAADASALRGRLKVDRMTVNRMSFFEGPLERMATLEMKRLKCDCSLIDNWRLFLGSSSMSYSLGTHSNP